MRVSGLFLCLVCVGCRWVAGYGAVTLDGAVRVDATADAALDAQQDGLLDGSGDQRQDASDGALDGRRELGRDGAADSYKGDSVPYPDLGNCPCSTGCPPLGGVCVMACQAGKPCICPVGYNCNMICAAADCRADCRFGKQCLIGCAGGADVCTGSPIYCGASCDLACTTLRACAKTTLYGSTGKNTIWCSGPSACINASIVGGTGHTTVQCSGPSSCDDATVDLTPSCGGRVACAALACTNTKTTCPVGCVATKCTINDCTCP